MPADHTPTDRDPANPAELAELAGLVATLNDAEQTSPEQFGAAAKRLLDALLDQGCLNPTEHATATLGDLDDGTARVLLDSGEVLRVDEAGVVRPEQAD